MFAKSLLFLDDFWKYYYKYLPVNKTYWTKPTDQMSSHWLQLRMQEPETLFRKKKKSIFNISIVKTVFKSVFEEYPKNKQTKKQPQKQYPLFFYITYNISRFNKIFTFGSHSLPPSKMVSVTLPHVWMFLCNSTMWGICLRKDEEYPAPLALSSRLNLFRAWAYIGSTIQHY